MWDPITQTYKDGIVPSHHTAIDIDELLALNNGKLKIFGYGSLCWHPGYDGVLSLARLQDDDDDDNGSGGGDSSSASPASNDKNKGDDTQQQNRKVTTKPGRAIGYQRCWSQRSADHRGTTSFNGIVCTLLSDDEVDTFLHHKNDGTNDDKKEDAKRSKRREHPSMTEGLIYTVDVDLVDDCLAELDFREKGGYARDVIDVVEDETGNTVKALLYRGTPDNPAFWKRVLLDLQYAAAVISVARGPSGSNDVYLLNLHTFLTNAAQHSSDAALALANHSGDYHTGQLAGMVKVLQAELRPYFLFGAGSNEHNQLLLNSINKEEVDELNEVLLVVPRQQNSDDNPKSIHAGGGHSALLTNNGDFYLWGWNDSNQLGREEEPVGETVDDSPSLNVAQPLSNIKVETADLGHNHTLVIAKDTGRLLSFGENGRGQVSGSVSDDRTDNSWHVPQTPIGLEDDSFIDVAAGLFHSAAITDKGELITWGCGRFGQCLAPTNNNSTVGRWQPNDGSMLVKVACGRRHTVVLDEHGRVWTLGDNKYGQLGRLIDDSSNSKDREPQLVDGPLGQVNSGCFAVCSGWSHMLALSRDTKDSDTCTLYGWGRNDKGQLASMPGASQSYISIPQVLNSESLTVQAACCGAESSHVVDLEGKIMSSGWNEHGNLGIGHYDQQNDDKTSESSSTWMATTGTRVVAPPSTNSKEEEKTTKILLAAGGAHLIAVAAVASSFSVGPDRH